ncbi:MAG: aspartate kinase [Nitrososphaerales archaeon]
MKKIVMKFGGSSIATGEKVRHVAGLLKSESKENSVIAVTSAVRGMTDELLKISESVRKGNRTQIENFIDRVGKTHLDIASAAVQKSRTGDELKSIERSLIKELEDVLGGMVLLGEVTPKSQDYLLSFGERLATPIVCYALRDMGVKAEFLTGKDAGIVTDSSYGEARPLMDTTRLRVAHKIEPMLKDGVVPVVTGFVTADQNGNRTTLGRGGSDYTATIIASCIHADEVWLWTDVDGLMTADPKIAKDAKVLKEVSYSEAMEMALFGAKYIHPRALEPIVDNSIPVRIRNTFKPENAGTLVLKSPKVDSQQIVKAVSAIRTTALIYVWGGSMVGAPGTAAKIFSVLGENGVNIIMISQGPSESSISMVVRKGDLDRAVNSLELNLLGKMIKSVNVTDDVAIVAAVGSGMRGIKGVASRIFGALARRNINVIMIAQGSSELNLAFVVNDRNCEGAVEAIHEEFELSKPLSA